MELNEIDGFDKDGNPTTIQLPVLRVVKQALLALDYSQGALENQMAANQLADQFCLSEIQRTVAREDSAKFWLIFLRPTDIREQLDLPRRRTLIREILMHLAADGHAERLGSSGRLDITENGIKVIEER